MKSKRTGKEKEKEFTVADRILEIQKEKALTDEPLSTRGQRYDISGEHLHGILHKGKTNITIGTIIKLCRMLGVTAGELLDKVVGQKIVKNENHTGVF